MQNSRLFAGELDDFEKDATKQKTKQEHTVESSRDEKDSDFLGDLLSELFLKPIGESFGEVIVKAGRSSMLRVDDSACKTEGIAEGITCRQIGEPLIPYLKADLNFQNVKPDITAIDGKVELGYGPFGFQFRRTHFKEKETRDRLDVDQYHGLFRISYKSYFELDFGIGELTLNGNDSNSGFSFTLPIKVQPTGWIGFYFLPAWSILNGNTISDYDISVPFTRRFFSVQIGYRWLKSPHESLDGPYLGGSIHF